MPSSASTSWWPRRSRVVAFTTVCTAWWYHNLRLRWHEQDDAHFINPAFVADWVETEAINVEKDSRAGKRSYPATVPQPPQVISPYRSNDGLAGHIRTYYNRTAAFVADISASHQHGLVGGPNGDTTGATRRSLLHKWSHLASSPSGGTFPAISTHLMSKAVGIVGEYTKAYPPLTTHIEDVVDVCVIGGGLAGLHAALSLGERGKKVVLLEGNRVACGASGRNGGDAIIGFHEDIDHIAKYVGVANAKILFKDSIAGYDRLKSLIFGPHGKIACEAAETGAVTVCFGKRPDVAPHPSKPPGNHGEGYSEHSPTYQHMLEEEKAAARHVLDTYGDKREVLSLSEVKRRLGVDLTAAQFHFSHGIFNPRNITVNPLALSLGLARLCIETDNVSIFENSRVATFNRQPAFIAHRQEADARGHGKAQEADRIGNTVTRFGAGDWLVVCDNGATVRAKEIVVATNSASWCLPKLAPCTLPLATAIMVTPPFPKEALDQVLKSQLAVFDDRFALAYFRRVDGDRIMFGSLASGKPLDLDLAKVALMKELIKFFPSLTTYAKSSNTPSGFMEPDIIWQGKIETRGPVVFPLVGRDDHSGVWYSLGFGGHGLVPTCAAGEVLASAIASIPIHPQKDAETTDSGELLQPTDTRYQLWNKVTAVPELLQPSASSSWRPPMLVPVGLFGPLSSMGLIAVTDYIYPLADFLNGRV